VEEFGQIVAFLCSEPASYVTGAGLQVDGGLYRGLM
jgi:3-oxoacyl-[acyl-carrier protein] reductase